MSQACGIALGLSELQKTSILLGELERLSNLERGRRAIEVVLNVLISVPNLQELQKRLEDGSTKRFKKEHCGLLQQMFAKS